jgi:uncharacterized protein YbjT (DUF2867 family)
MSYLVLGGTGTVGSAVVKGLVEKGERVRVLTRSQERAATLPEGAEPVVGDLRDPDSYGRVFDGARRIFLLNAVVDTELQEGLAAVNEAKRVNAERVVYLSVHDVEKGPHIPHFASKIAIEKAIKDLGLTYTILRPNNFYQNDFWYVQALTEYGVYPQPIGERGCSRVDIRDIAEAAVNALTEDGHENLTYALVGPEPLTGSGTAQIYGEAMGREIAYAGDLESFRQQARQMVPAWMVYDFTLMYGLFQEQGLVATDVQVAESERVVGHPPRAFRDFAQELVAGMKASAG